MTFDYSTAGLSPSEVVTIEQYDLRSGKRTFAARSEPAELVPQDQLAGREAQLVTNSAGDAAWVIRYGRNETGMNLDGAKYEALLLHDSAGTRRAATRAGVLPNAPERIQNLQITGTTVSWSEGSEQHAIALT
ncbi:MAG TPA: hypothetical protein VLJ80_00920 [Solirubrobacteraceae bacterium]|nr:hypothetical protein [Solirubrobacteraceae bacterium]